MTREYVYKISDVVKVVDGDTAYFRVDAGFRAWILVHWRLLGYDCPERNRGSQFERNEAKAAGLLTSSFLAQPRGQLWVRTERDPDDFGRWLGDVWREVDGSEIHLGDVLADQGLATKWPTRWRDVYDKAAV
jgi:endonuclease YncB( thermonuclease family)